MKKWHKSYTYAIITVAVIIAAFLLFWWLENRPFTFSGSDGISHRLETWTPASAVSGKAHSVEGKILYYKIDCFKSFLFLSSYEGPEKAGRSFQASDLKSADEIGAIAVLYYDRALAFTYTNGAGAYRNDCTVYILDSGTLEVLAKETVRGASPAATSSGGDRYGDAPTKAACRSAAERLVEGLNK